MEQIRMLSKSEFKTRTRNIVPTETVVYTCRISYCVKKCKVNKSCVNHGKRNI